MGLHLAGASSPLVVFPRRCFTRPWRPTLEGQYIVKNVVLAAAGLELAARTRRRDSGAASEGNRRRAGSSGSDSPLRKKGRG